MRLFSRSSPSPTPTSTRPSTPTLRDATQANQTGASPGADVDAKGWSLRTHAQSSVVASLRTELNRLQRFRSPQDHATQKDWLRSLDRRLAEEAGQSPAARDRLLAELQVLELETRIALRARSPKSVLHRLIKAGPERQPLQDEDREAIMGARKKFAAALFRELGGQRGLDARLLEHQRQLSSTDPAAHAAVLIALDAARHLDDAELRHAPRSVSTALTRQAQEAQRAGGPSAAPREAPRMPNDVLVHLASVVRVAARRQPHDEALRRVGSQAQQLFVTHGASLAAVRGFAATAAEHLARAGEHGAAARCVHLAQQLPVRTQAGATSLNRHQLHDNPYGRVFDSQWMAHLVNDPPASTLAAMAAVSQAYAGRMDLGDDVAGQTAGELRELLRSHPRPWINEVPGLNDFLATQDWPSARQALVSYLRSPVVDGFDAVARAYLLIKAGPVQRDVARDAGEKLRAPAFMAPADTRYQQIGTQALRQFVGQPGGRLPRGVAGIALSHQPPAVSDPRLEAALRPTQQQRVGGVTKKNPEAAPNYSRALDLQHEHGMPVGVGVSGSTNLLLHLFADLRDNGEVSGVDARDVLLAGAMTLTYDGGHSVHEALWTANLNDGPLKLGLGLSDGKQAPEEFVSDYAAFANRFPAQTRARLQATMGRAWAATQDHLQKHSHFARPRGESLPSN